MARKDITKADFKVFTEFEVHWGDMDAARHVNNLVYLKWSETLRIDYFDQIGIDTEFDASEIGPILGWQDCKYIYPITYPDRVWVGLRTSELQEDRFILECAVFSVAEDKLASISHHTVIPYDYGELKKAAMPESWISAIKALEG